MIGIPDWVWHPLNGQGYQFWSGIGSDLGELSIFAAIVAALATFYRHHNCHVYRCPYPAWHPDETGHPVCRRHHPDHPAGTVRGKSDS